VAVGGLVVDGCRRYSDFVKVTSGPNAGSRYSLKFRCMLLAIMLKYSGSVDSSRELIVQSRLKCIKNTLNEHDELLGPRVEHAPNSTLTASGECRAHYAPICDIDRAACTTGGGANPHSPTRAAHSPLACTHRLRSSLLTTHHPNKQVLSLAATFLASG
jgi:hypothetical protein